MTDEQFYYKTRKNTIGLYKKETWELPAEKKAEIAFALEEQFRKLFVSLGMEGTRKVINDKITQVKITPDLKYYLGKFTSEDGVSDLAD